MCFVFVLGFWHSDNWLNTSSTCPPVHIAGSFFGPTKEKEKKMGKKELGTKKQKQTGNGLKSDHVKILMPLVEATNTELYQLQLQNRKLKITLKNTLY